ncbi:MAG: FtsX-like permease family protein [Rhizobiales bacterium]|nr:FtsX-like permease family protein [Hyphomicrobiales bacterium]
MSIDTFAGTAAAGERSGSRIQRLAGIAIRDLRGQKRGFAVFLLCIALGVAAITAVGALNDAIENGLSRQGRALLGGDLELSRIHEGASGAERVELEELGTVASVVSMRAMARAVAGGPGAADPAVGSPTSAAPMGVGDPASALVEVKAIDRAYPLVGDLVLSDGKLAPGTGIGADSVVVAPELLSRLGVAVGDRIRLGDRLLTIRATIVDEPDKLSGRAAFGPRVILDIETLRAAGLVKPGGLLRWRYRVAFPGAGEWPEAGPAGERLSALLERFEANGFEVRNRRNPEPSLERAASRLAQFLTLVGLTSMLVGGVGVANSVAAYLDRKRRVIATFKSLGATSGDVFRIYLIEIMAITAAGIAIGLVAGYALLFALALLLESRLPIGIALTFDPLTGLLAAGYGLLVALVFVLWPLGRAEEASPVVLFRDGIDPGPWRPRLRYVIASIAATALLAAFAVVTAEDIRIALFFMAGLSGLFLLFHALAFGLDRIAPRLPRPRRPELRLALAHLAGPGSLARSVILSLGLGLSLLVTVSLVDRSLVAELETTLPDEAPSYFFLDIERDRIDEFRQAVLKVEPGAEVREAPMLRGRLVSVQGVPASKIKAAPEAAWVLDGDRGLTYSDDVPEGARVVEGEWWPTGYSGPPLVSFEVDLARGLGIGVGDEVMVNVLGRNVTARVANLRTVKWETLSINFVMIFSPNTLAAAPFSMLATVRFPERPDDVRRGHLTRELARQFPGATAINVQDAIDTFRSVFERVIGAVRAAGSLTLIVGAIVLAGALVTAQRRRIYETVILKALGATRASLMAIAAAEYLLLAVVTTTVAAAVGTVAAFVVTTEVLDVGFRFSLAAVLEALLLASVLVLTFGAIGTWRLLRAPVARTLTGDG